MNFKSTLNSLKNRLGMSPIALISIVFLILICLSQYQILRLKHTVSDLSGKLETAETNFASTTNAISHAISETQLALNKERENVGSLQENLGSFKKKVNSITGTVNDLEKLSKTDPELLQKYSKVFFLNEHYSPARLTEVPDAYEFVETRTTKINEQVWPFLKDMMDDAKEDGIDLFVSSGFRSFNEQGALKGAYTVTYGAGTANQFSADQGYSEHQLGTTVDFMTTGIGGVLDKFDGTPAYNWLTTHAHKYGFTLSYPKSNAYYIYEPWHWRFVGIDLAQDLYKDKKHFYDLDQREIDTYLIDLFED